MKDNHTLASMRDSLSLPRVMRGDVMTVAQDVENHRSIK